MKTKLAGGLILSLTVLAVVLYPSIRSAATVVTTASDSQAIEVVFVLDTTSSMSGLIETAKEKIWSIASTMAQAEQAPVIRMGLVGFRDRGDAYVTEVVDLSADLDSMYARLMQFAAVGGGDGPESVNAALAAALERISWSEDSSSTYQVMFLVGDAPPHMDYQGEAQYPEIVRSAAARGIVVNTIHCGDVAQTVGPWTEIARLGNGRYMKVGQAGDAFAVTTPYDQELAELSAELDRTRLYYGSADEQAEFDLRVAATESLHRVASPASQARRAVFNASAAGAANRFGAGDLVDDVASGRVNLEDVPSDNLPASLSALSLDELNLKVQSASVRRQEVQTQIETLRDARSSYIEKKVEQAGGAGNSLDWQIFEAVVEQAGNVGLTYEASGPDF
jgi:Mg-chelatase subunit ChlD